MHKTCLTALTFILIAYPIFAADWQPVEGRIMTQWADQVNPESPLPEYPRPAMQRADWMNLNGLWNYAIVDKNVTAVDDWGGKILVPFAVESALSGVAKRVGVEKALWYRREFTIPDEWHNQRVLLHFGAVDWQSTIWVNGKEVGSHKGGYDPFTLDITDALKDAGPQQITVRIWDPTNENNSPIARGKQVTNPGGIWYTPVTGIWQTVWLEPVPKAYIKSIKVTPDLDRQQVKIETAVDGVNPQTHMAEKYFLRISASDGKTIVDSGMGHLFAPMTLTFDNIKEWSPDNPFLYDLNVNLLQEDTTVDSVKSYFGMRKIEMKKDDNGINRLFLNNEPVFQFGLLDQGWWPDGLYTAPTDDALRYDVEMTKKWGFNMLRKHVKVEPQRLYYWCDKLGVLVWQDMPSSLFDRDRYSAEELQKIDAQFESEWKAIVNALYNHPSIVMWVPFNEGWGQYDTERITAETKMLDQTRLVNNASGWTDRGVGDVHDIHTYPGPTMPELEDDRAAVLGEFGGLGLPVRDHLWEAGGNWGYRTYQDTSMLERQYVELIQKLYPLVDKGLAAAVYTQTTDVEIEVNGLMTYDRKVVKLDPEKFAPLNRGCLPPTVENDRLLFIDTIQVKLIGNKDLKIRYTLDGSEPTADSTLYAKPITLNKTTTVTARSFWPDGIISPPVSWEFRKTTPLKPIDDEVDNEGLNVALYDGQWTSLPVFSELTPVQTVVANTIGLDRIDKTENFALRFIGFIKAPQTGIYQFTLNSDDGTRLFIAGRKLINNDGVHGMNAISDAIALQSGWHPIEVQYFQGVGGLGLELLWEGPGLTRGPVSPDALGH